jgi:pilus assembly protein CpaB
MKSRAVIPLVFGLAIGVFAIKYFVDVVKRAKGASNTQMVNVICAVSDIPATVEIKDTMVDVKSVPKALAPKLCFQDKGELRGRVTSLPIATGMPIVPNLLAPQGTPAGLTVRIPDGHRAVAIQVDEFAGVAGWIKPGSRVDVVAVMSGRSGAQNETISKVILQNVEVLTVGQDIGGKTDVAAAVARSVTLCVEPAEVPRLHLAATKGKIRLAMRNQIDAELVRSTGQTTDNDLLGLPDSSSKTNGAKPGGFLAGLFGQLGKSDEKATDKEAKARAAAPPVQVVAAAPKKEWVIELMSGSRVEQVRFEGDGKSLRRVPSGKGRGLTGFSPPLEAQPEAPALTSEPGMPVFAP